MEPKEVQKYMEHLVQLLRQQFGEQLLYVGLQGSCRHVERRPKTATSTQWLCWRS